MKSGTGSPSALAIASSVAIVGEFLPVDGRCLKDRADRLVEVAQALLEWVKSEDFDQQMKGVPHREAVEGLA